MPDFYKIRDRIKAYRTAKVLKVAEFLYKKGLTSNMLSVLGLICGLAAAFFLFKDHTVFVILIFIAILLDNLDGPISRVEKKKGEGWIVDIACDRTVTMALLIALALNIENAFVWPTIAIFLFTNLFLIYEKLVLKRNLKMIHVDVSLQILLIFSFYQFGLFLLLISTLINFFLMLLQLKKSSVEGEFTMANVISVVRPILLIYALWQFQNQPLILAAAIIIIIIMDAIDGMVARRFTASKFGGFIDIAADRAVELIILFTYAYWGLISYIFPIIFTFRGVATDFLRVLNNKYKDPNYKEPLSIGKADNRFMRGLYALIKLAAFSIILIYPKIGLILMLIALIMNLYRGLPVIFSSRSKVLIKKFLS